MQQTPLYIYIISYLILRCTLRGRVCFILFYYIAYSKRFYIHHSWKKWRNLTNPTMHLYYVPQYKFKTTGMYIFLFWMVHCALRNHTLGAWSTGNIMLITPLTTPPPPPHTHTHTLTEVKKGSENILISYEQRAILLTHWGRMTRICVGNLTVIGSDNGLSPGRRQAIIWTNAGILLIGPLGTNFNEILIEIHTFSFKKMHLKMSSGKWRLFCLGLNVLTHWHLGDAAMIW